MLLHIWLVNSKSLITEIALFLSEVSRLQEPSRGTSAQYFEVSRRDSFKVDREKKIPIFGREKIADQGQVSPTRTMRRGSGVPAGTDGIDRRAGVPRARNRREKERRRRGSSAKGIAGGRAGSVDRPASTLNPSRIRIQCSHHDDSRDTASVRASPEPSISRPAYASRDPIDPIQ